MNIFTILKQGDGSINEANVSAFLRYLLDIKGSHGMNEDFFSIFLESLNLKIEDGIEEFNIILESKQKVLGTLNSSDIDIVITYKDGEKYVALLIENKINDRAVSNMRQLIEQRERFLNLNKRYSETRSILIAPNESSSNSLYGTIDNVTEKNRLFWKLPNESNTLIHSIEGIILSLLEKERFGKISPINSTTKYFLKSFLNFININFGLTPPQGINNRPSQVVEEDFLEYINSLTINENVKTQLFSLNDFIIRNFTEGDIVGKKAQKYYAFYKNGSIFLKLIINSNDFKLGVRTRVVPPNLEGWEQEDHRPTYTAKMINENILIDDVIGNVIRDSYNSIQKPSSF